MRGDPQEIQEIATWLTQDENPCLWVDPLTGTNAYGVAPWPQTGLKEWGSATASGLSDSGLEVARQVLHDGFTTPRFLAAELLAAYGLDPDAYEVAFYPSGTAALAAGAVGWQGALDQVLICHPDDTGSNVHLSLAQKGLALTVVSAYGETGQRLSPMAYSRDFARQVGQGKRVLMVMTEVTKSGSIIPDEATVLACQQRDRQRLQVLVDACQGRFTAQRLREYLDRGWRVAITGSKFIGGPPFSGALLGHREGPGKLPTEAMAQSLAPGACLRWRVALAELQAWQRADHRPLAACLVEFQRRLFDRMATEPRLCLEPVTRLGHLSGSGDWDDYPTIFPFSVALPGGMPGWLGQEALRRLLLELVAPGRPLRGRWGQPVCLHRTAGEARWALRICLGVRQLLPWLDPAVESRVAVAQAVEECAELLHETVVLAARQADLSVTSGLI